MGNSFCVVLDNYTAASQFPSYQLLGTYAAIDFSKSVRENNDGGHSEKWTVLYIIDGPACDELSLTRYVEKDGTVKRLSLLLRGGKDPNCEWLRMKIERTETNFLDIEFYQDHSTEFESIGQSKTSRTVDALGVITHTLVQFYGRRNSGGLVVTEMKYKVGDELPRAVTVAQYFANSRGTAFNRTETNIGLSMVVKIRPNNGVLEINMEKLEQHPPSALFFLFDEVQRNWIWKPTMCPHCATNRRGRTFWQFDSQDSSSVPWRNSRVISNNGRQNGNFNGNIIERNNIIIL